MEELKARNYLDGSDDTCYLVDWWQNPFTYKCRTAPNFVEVEISSKGRNQQYEDGAGDGLTLKVTKAAGKVTNVIRVPTARGVEEFSMEPLTTEEKDKK